MDPKKLFFYKKEIENIWCVINIVQEIVWYLHFSSFQD